MNQQNTTYSRTFYLRSHTIQHRMQARVAGFLNGIHAISGRRQYKRYLIVSIFQPYCIKCFQIATRGRS